MDKIKSTIGRRKQSTTRVFLKKGEGKITVNNKPYKEYFTIDYLQKNIEYPLELAGMLNHFDIKITVSGGGIKGQAESAKLALARAIVEIDAALKPKLKAEGMLTRNSKEVERKKFGHKKARKSFQFSKR